MERHLVAKGAFETFKAAFAASNGSTWDQERDAVDFLRDDIVAALAQAARHDTRNRLANGSTAPGTTSASTSKVLPGW
jgi:hypothetical protein